jgi:histone H3
VAALREIRKYQRSEGLLIPHLPFARLTREIMYDCSNGRSFRIQKSALDAIQEATEAVIVNELGCKLLWFIVIIILIKIVANLAAIHAKRITIQVKDMLLVRAMRKGMTGHRYPGGGRITEPEN